MYSESGLIAISHTRGDPRLLSLPPSRNRTRTPQVVLDNGGYTESGLITCSHHTAELAGSRTAFPERRFPAWGWREGPRPAWAEDKSGPARH